MIIDIIYGFCYVVIGIIIGIILVVSIDCSVKKKDKKEIEEQKLAKEKFKKSLKFKIGDVVWHKIFKNNSFIIIGYDYQWKENKYELEVYYLRYLNNKDEYDTIGFREEELVIADVSNR